MFETAQLSYINSIDMSVFKYARAQCVALLPRAIKIQSSHSSSDAVRTQNRRLNAFETIKNHREALLAHSQEAFSAHFQKTSAAPFRDAFLEKIYRKILNSSRGSFTERIPRVLHRLCATPFCRAFLNCYRRAFSLRTVFSN